MDEQLRPIFYQRDFSPSVQPGFELRVERLTWAAEGGPETAELRGEAAYLAAGLKFPQWALDYLRRPVEIVDPGGEVSWWGYVGRVEVQSGGVASIYDLDRMANRVRVMYWRRQPQVEWVGEKTLTPWAENPRSVAQYGRKERVYFLPSIEEAQALAARTSWLNKVGEPYAEVEAGPVDTYPPQPSPGLYTTSGGEVKSQDKVQVRMICRGWYSTLGWIYPEVNTGFEGFTKPAQTIARMGQSSTSNAQIAQSFRLSYGPTLLREVVVDLKQIGVNTDNVVMDLCADSAGVPGTVLASVSVAASAISGGRWNVRFVFSSPVTVQASTTYWIRLSRSGAVNASNHYNAFMEATNSYTDGKHMTWNGTAWVDVLAGLADLNFYTVALSERATRISVMSGASWGGQFLSGVRLSAPVSGNTLRFLEGSQTVLEVFEEIFKSGDTNGVRLVGRVNRERELIVESLAVEGTAGYVIGQDGVIRTLSGRRVGVSEDLAGKRALLGPGWLDESVILWRVEWTPAGGIRARVERK